MERLNGTEASYIAGKQDKNGRSSEQSSTLHANSSGGEGGSKSSILRQVHIVGQRGRWCICLSIDDGELTRAIAVLRKDSCEGIANP